MLSMLNVSENISQQKHTLSVQINMTLNFYRKVCFDSNLTGVNTQQLKSL
jgi:Trm5-related predicted tRNA methylase